MAKSDTSERWFEARVVRGLTGVPQPEYSHDLAPTDFAATHNGYVQGKPTDYNRDVALDVAQLLAFLQATQPKTMDTLELAADAETLSADLATLDLDMLLAEQGFQRMAPNLLLAPGGEG